MGDLLFWRWGFRFVLNAMNNAFVVNTTNFIRNTSPWALATVQAVASSADIPGNAYSSQSGCLTVQVSAKSSANAEHQVKELADRGLPVEAFSKMGTLREEPTLLPAAARIHSSFLSPNDHSSDCEAFTRRLAQRCTATGVRVTRGAQVKSLDWEDNDDDAPRITGVVLTDGSRLENFDQVVICAGCGSTTLLRKLGIYLPIYPCKGYALQLCSGDAGADLPVLHRSSLHFDPLDLFVTQYSGSCPEDHRIRFTSIAEFAGWDEDPVSERARAALRRRAQAVYPTIPSEVWDHAEVRVGGRPWSADDLPIVGGTRFANLWLNTGHGHTGWRFACCTAEVLAAAMVGSEWPSSILKDQRSTCQWPNTADVQRLSLSRFAELWRTF